jgi:multicomponent Na+:H+ antiporter subunit C
VIWAVALGIGTVITVGTYLALTRDLLRCVIGLALLGNGINLLLFAGGRLVSQVPPIIPGGEAALGAAPNPQPQAQTLTANVISFALLCFSLALALRIMQLSGSDDVTQLRVAEPPAADAVKPPLEDAS